MNQKGVTIIEAVIAAAILGLVILAAVVAMDNVRQSADKVSHFDATRQTEQLMRIETTRAIHKLIESGAGPSICALSPAPGLVDKASALALNQFTGAVVPNGAPKEWGDMRSRCGSGNQFSGAKGRLCFKLAFTDAKLQRKFPNAAVEVTVALKNQIGGTALSCGSYRSIKSRGFHLFYSIYYAKRAKDELEFKSFSGTYYGGGSNDF